MKRLGGNTKFDRVTEIVERIERRQLGWYRSRKSWTQQIMKIGDSKDDDTNERIS